MFLLLRAELQPLTDVAPLQRVCVVLVSARNPLNIGAAARAMSNFGFQHLRVVQPYEAAFREARSAVGAEDLLARAAQFDTLAEAVADCGLVVGTTALQHRELRHPMFSLPEGGTKIREHLAAASSQTLQVAVLFGSEKRGLSNQDLSHCHWLLHIPTDPQQPSINLAQAVAVFLYELARSSFHPKGVPAFKAASSAELERMTEVLLQVLDSSGYKDAQAGAAHRESIRRMVRRLSLSHEDATVWLGILRQILWKIHSRWSP